MTPSHDAICPNHVFFARWRVACTDSSFPRDRLGPSVYYHSACGGVSLRYRILHSPKPLSLAPSCRSMSNTKVELCMICVVPQMPPVQESSIPFPRRATAKRAASDTQGIYDAWARPVCCTCVVVIVVVVRPVSSGERFAVLPTFVRCFTPISAGQEDHCARISGPEVNEKEMSQHRRHRHAKQSLAVKCARIALPSSQQPTAQSGKSCPLLFGAVVFWSCQLLFVVSSHALQLSCATSPAQPVVHIPSSSAGP